MKVYFKIFSIILLEFLLLITSRAQTLYTDVLSGVDSAQMIAVDDYLYVGTGGGIIYQIDLTDPSPDSAVEINDPTGSFAFAFDHWPNNNSIYFSDFASNFYRADLDQSFPIELGLLNTTFPTFASSIRIYNNTLYYFWFEPRVWAQDLSDPTSSFELFYISEDPTDDIFGTPAFVGDYMYYVIDSNDATGTNSKLSRLDLSASLFEEELVIPDLGGRVLGGYQLDDILYLSVQGPGTDHVLRLDLSSETPVSDVILDFTSPTYSLGITSYNDSLYVVTSNGLIYKFEDPILNTTDNEYSQVFAVPNPTTERVSISGIRGKSVFTIYSVDGRLLKSGFVNVNEYIDLDSFTTGIYFLELVQNGNKEVIRVIKQ